MILKRISFYLIAFTFTLTGFTLNRLSHPLALAFVGDRRDVAIIRIAAEQNEQQHVGHIKGLYTGEYEIWIRYGKGGADQKSSAHMTQVECSELSPECLGSELQIEVFDLHRQAALDVQSAWHARGVSAEFCSQRAGTFRARQNGQYRVTVTIGENCTQLLDQDSELIVAPPMTVLKNRDVPVMIVEGSLFIGGALAAVAGVVLLLWSLFRKTL